MANSCRLEEERLPQRIPIENEGKNLSKWDEESLVYRDLAGKPHCSGRVLGLTARRREGIS